MPSVDSSEPPCHARTSSMTGVGVSQLLDRLAQHAYCQGLIRTKSCQKSSLSPTLHKVGIAKPRRAVRHLNESADILLIVIEAFKKGSEQGSSSVGVWSNEANYLAPSDQGRIEGRQAIRNQDHPQSHALPRELVDLFD